MKYPLEELLTSTPELRLALAVLIGFGFGFALERAGFGRATKLAGQFYLRDMTVFKVMFAAIVTAMLGLVIAGELGVIDLHGLSVGAASQTFLWPMAIGGFILGVGFIVAGYCPGTSIVAASSGNVDGLVTIGGVVAGSVIYAYAYPLLGDFPQSGAQGHLFLYELLDVEPAMLAAGIAAAAMLMFLGAEKVEAIFSRRAREKDGQAAVAPETARAHGRAFGVFTTAAAVALAAMFLVPVSTDAEPARARVIPVETLAEQVLEAPWNVRVIDIRSREECAEQRIPHSECVPADELGDLGLQYSPGTRDLVIVGAGELEALPEAAYAYTGRTCVLGGGFEAWRRYALEAPEPPEGNADSAARAEYQLRAGLNKALTGVAPPPPPPVEGFVAPPKPRGGGCQ